MHFSSLNQDVIFEIFLRFVAIDWDGPFNLILVCAKWRDIVVSKPRLWTWIMLDHAQPDWKQRALVSAALSRRLPLKLVLRIPFRHIKTLTSILSRCTSVFLNTDHHTSRLTQRSSPVTREDFTRERDEYEALHIVIAEAIVSLSKQGVEAIVESTHESWFSFAKWSIYERVFKARTLKGQLKGMPAALITRLVFKDKARNTPRQIAILSIWPYLPFLPYLDSLELSDNFLGEDNPTTVPDICLASLTNLTIECSVGWEYRAGMARFTLFSVLSRIDTPSLHALTMSGSFSHVFIAVRMSNKRVRPSDLTMSFSSFGNTRENLIASSMELFHSVGQLTLDFLDSEWPSSTATGTLRKWIIRTLTDLFLSPSVHRSVRSMRLRGGEELQHMMRIYMPGINSLDIVYRDGSSHFEMVSKEKLDLPPRIRSLTLKAGWSESYTMLRWVQSAEQVFVKGHDLHNLLMEYKYHPSSITVLDTGICTHRGQYDAFRLYRSTFSNLTRLRCTVGVACEIFESFKTPKLCEIALVSQPDGPRSFFPLWAILKFRVDALPELSIIAMEGFPAWGYLTALIRKFKKSLGGGITTVKVPGLPHPSVLRGFVDALGADSEGVKLNQYITAGNAAGCHNCFWTGWRCILGDQCTRFSTSSLVSITKDTIVVDVD